MHRRSEHQALGSPAVSVILPVFNRLKYLRPAVDSVFAQTFSDWELIIADDGSEGKTAIYLAMLEDLPRVKLLRLLHTGNPGAVRNAALCAARGEYIAFLDSDDLWPPEKLQLQIAAQRAHAERRWSYTAIERIGKNGQVMPGEGVQRRVLYEGAIFEPLLTLRAAVGAPSVIAERSLIQEVGGFDEDQFYFEEYDLWLRLSLVSDVTVVREPIVLIRSHDEHYSADRVGVYQARLRLLDKMTALAWNSHLRCVVRLEQSKTAAELAAAYAARGRSADALKTLWRSRECAWRCRRWWRNARATLGRAVAPSWLLETARSYRNRTSRPPRGPR